MKSIYLSVAGSKPRNVEAITPCSQTVLKSRPKGICDYQVFENTIGHSEHPFEVNVAQSYRTRTARLWTDLLKEETVPKTYSL